MTTMRWVKNSKGEYVTEAVGGSATLESVTLEVTQQDIALAAKNMVGRMSQRTGQLGWTVDGNSIITSHYVTSRNYGSIDLKTGEIIPTRPQDRSALQSIVDVIHKEAKLSKARQDLEILRQYPFRDYNKAQILKLEALYPELAIPEEGKIIPKTEPTAKPVEEERIIDLRYAENVYKGSYYGLTNKNALNRLLKAQDIYKQYNVVNGITKEIDRLVDVYKDRLGIETAKGGNIGNE